MSDVSPDLALALLALHTDVATLPKDGWNDHSKYRYAKGDTVVREARKIMAKHGLFWIRTGSRLKPPTLAAGRLGNSKDYVGDVEIAGFIVHKSGACLAVAGETPIVVMAALPHDKSWAASITFGTGYVLLGVLNQDKADEADIAAREDDNEPVCEGEFAHLATDNARMTEALAAEDSRPREETWAWVCGQCDVEPIDGGFPGPKQLYVPEGERVREFLQRLIAAADAERGERAKSIRLTRTALAALAGKDTHEIWREVARRLGAPERVTPEELTKEQAFAADAMLTKWLDAKKATATTDPTSEAAP